MSMEVLAARTEGVKDSEVGPIPEDWETVALGDAFDIQQGKAMSPAGRARQPQYPFLRTLNVLWGRIDLSTLDHMHFTAQELSRLRLEPNDILVCEGGEVGRTAIWRGELEVCAHQNHIHRLRKRRDDICPEYYMYWMQTAFLQLGLYAGEGIKTTIPNLSQGRLQSFVLPKPPLHEQQSISLVLSKIQQAVYKQDLLLLAIRNLKKSLMHKLLTSGVYPTKYKEGGEIGAVPEKWKPTTLSEVLTVAQYGLSLKGSKEGQYPILRMNNLEDGDLVLDDVQYVDLDEETFRRFRLKKGDLLFNRTNSIDLVGKTSFFDLEGELVFASYLIRLQTDPKQVLPQFVNYYLNWANSQRRLKGLASRAVGQSNISATRLRTFQIPLPPIPEQQEIVNLLMSLDRKIKVEENRKSILQQLFNTMLRKLAIGIIRLKDFDLGAQYAS